MLFHIKAYQQDNSRRWWSIETLFFQFFQELVAANPSQKNWKGISIAIFVIVLVLGSVALAVVIRTPKDKGPRYTGDRITINHILDPKYYPRNFNGSWISGKRFYNIWITYWANHLKVLLWNLIFAFSFVSDTEIVFLDSKGGLSILDVTSLNQSQIVSNIVFVSTSNHCFMILYWFYICNT